MPRRFISASAMSLTGLARAPAKIVGEVEQVFVRQGDDRRIDIGKALQRLRPAIGTPSARLSVHGGAYSTLRAIALYQYGPFKACGPQLLHRWSMPGRRGSRQVASRGSRSGQGVRLRRGRRTNDHGLDRPHRRTIVSD
jgi:hypothetical protein